MSTHILPFFCKVDSSRDLSGPSHPYPGMGLRVFLLTTLFASFSLILINGIDFLSSFSFVTKRLPVSIAGLQSPHSFWIDFVLFFFFGLRLVQRTLSTRFCLSRAKIFSRWAAFRSIGHSNASQVAYFMIINSTLARIRSGST